jgi:hypothetical protein
MYSRVSCNNGGAAGGLRRVGEVVGMLENTR